MNQTLDSYSENSKKKHVVSLTYFSFAHPTLAADHWGVVGGVLVVVAEANHCYLAGGH